MLDPVVEALAAIEHEQWVQWSQEIAATEMISDERRERWKRLWVPYDQLSEEDKTSDREYACKVIDRLMKDHMTVLLAVIKRGM